jgi:hypothetical protein
MSDQGEPWRPLSRRHDPGYDSLYDFVPAWLQPSLWAWVYPHLHYTGQASGHELVDQHRLHELERRLRIEFDWSRAPGSALEQLKFMMRNDKAGKFALDVVDLLASDMSVTSHRDDLDRLEQILKEAGSAWTVVTRDGVGRLERRVDATVAESATNVMQESGRAGELLSKAWGAIYGRKPDASSGYRYAVKAVEAAAKPVISPGNASTTLGTVIRDMKAAPQKWTVRMSPAGRVDAMETLINMVQLLWKAQFDRHGTPDPNVPIDVSQEEAETALHLATTLVHWFSRGGITARA